MFPSDDYEIKSILFNSQDRSQGTIENPLFILPETLSIDAIKVKNSIIGFSIPVIGPRNNKVYFKEHSTAGTLTATIPTGYYTGTSLATALDDALTSAGSHNYTVAYSSTSNKMSITCGATVLFTTGNNAANYELGFPDGFGSNTFGSLFLTDQIDVSGVKTLNISSNVGATTIFGSNKKLLASIPTIADNLEVDLYTDPSSDYINCKQTISEINFKLYDERMREIQSLDKDWGIQLLFMQKN